MSALAVLDLGKTNSKLFIFDEDGKLLAQDRTKPRWDSYRNKSVLDEDALLNWMHGTLGNAAETYGADRVMISAHGCTFSLVGGGNLLHPILDYEQEIPDRIAAVIDPQLPDFSETYTPWLPLGFCIARHIYWLEAEEPDAFANTEAILCYPQHWVWRFTGRKLSEWSYLGAHSQVWAPLERDYSSLVDKLGWRSKFPPIEASGAEVGEMTVRLPGGGEKSLIVHNGVHDSNAALAYYRMTGLSGFTVVSTGTWVIIINLDCPLSSLNKERDMIANVTVLGEPAPSLRFMGGREFDLISGGWNKPISREAIETVIKRGIFAMPSWTAGGPFPETTGSIVGGAVQGEEKAAVALLYVTLMTDLSLDLIQSDNKLIIDGGLSKIDLYTSMLAQLRPDQEVSRSSMSEGSATGAAAIAFNALGRTPFRDETLPVEPGNISGLETYRSQWRAMAEGARADARASAAKVKA